MDKLNLPHNGRPRLLFTRHSFKLSRSITSKELKMHKKFVLALTLVLGLNGCAKAQTEEKILKTFDEAEPAMADQLQAADVKSDGAAPVVVTPANAEVGGVDPTATPTLTPEVAVEFFGERKTQELNGQEITLLSPNALRDFYNEQKKFDHWNAELVQKLVQAIEAAEDDALPPAKYHLALLRNFSNDEAHQVLASDAFLSLANDLANGLVNPKVTHPEWNGQKVSDEELSALLTKALGDGSFSATLNALNADNPRYQALRQEYVAQTRGETTGENPGKQLGNKVLRRGMEDPDVLVLREKLNVGGDSAVFDEELEAAVKAYQRKHKLGKKADGVVGPGTRNHLNGGRKNAKARIPLELLRINMERLRWLPQEMGASNIVVNIPDRNVRMFRDGRQIYYSRAIIGKTDRQTPAFVDRLRHVVMSPTWTVPPTLLKEKIEKGQVTSAYDLVSKSTGKSIGPAANGTVPPGYRLRMKSGPKNPLGRVKFLFPNSHAIYMHDTNAKGLFNSSRNGALESSGCVRIEHPVKLAQILLDGVKSPEQIKEDMAFKPKEVWSNPKESVPIYLVYWTVASNFDENGNLSLPRTVPDIYHKDGALKQQYSKVLNRYKNDSGALAIKD